jgi:hypothetical protein
MAAEPRWTELARVSAGATVFADFAEPDPDHCSPAPTPDVSSVTALFNRMVAYVDGIGD